MFFTRIAFFLVLGLCFSISFAAKDLLELYNEKVGSAADVVIAEMSKQLKDIASSGDYAAVSKSLRSLGVAQVLYIFHDFVAGNNLSNIILDDQLERKQSAKK